MNWLNYPAGRTADRRNLIWFVSLFAACLLKSIVTSESITSTFNETGSILSPTTSVLTSDDNHGLSTPFSSSFESLSNQTHFWFNDFRSEDHQNGYCVLGGICGFGGGVSDDAIIPCHVPHRPRKLRNEKLQMLRDFCPSLFDQDPHRDSFCCSEEQIDDMVENTRLAGSIGMENCPSCFQNFKQLFCQMSCSPHQSKLLQVVGQQKLDANFELEAKSSLNGFELLSTHGAEFTLQQTNEINLFVNRTLAQGVYDSCKSVRSMLGSSHSILRLMCDKEDCLVQDWLDFVGRHHKEDGRSPYRINFLITSGRQHESLYDLVQNESLAKHAVDSILVKPNWSNASQVLPINYHFYRCDQAISAKLGQCGCDNCEQTCAAILQDLRLLTHLSDKRPLSWARQLTVSLGWALFILLIAALLVYLTIFLLKAKRTYSQSVSRPLEAQSNDGHPEEHVPLRSQNDFGGKGEELFSNITTSQMIKSPEAFPVGSYSEHLKRTQQAEHILTELTDKSEPTLNLGLRLEAFFEHWFERWGSFVALHPISVMSVSLIISITLAFGLSCYKVTTDPVDLWVASGSQARQDMQYFSDNFWKFYRIEQVILVPRHAHPFNGSYVNEKNETIHFGSVFSRSLLIEALELQLQIERLTTVNERTGKTVKLSDICFQPLPGKCATQSIFTYFNNNVTRIREEPNYLHHIDICTKNPTLTGKTECMAKGGIPLIYPETSLGGFNGRNFNTSASLVLTFPVNNYNLAQQNEDALAWEQSFLDLMAERARDPNSNFTIAYKAEKSIEDELNRQSESDVVTIAVSYLIMFVYILLALGESGPVCSLQSSRCTLGFVGVAVVLLSVLSSLGFFFYLGIPATLIIVEVIPFLVLAVGVDNIFILVQAFQRQPPAPHLPLHVEIGQLVGQVAPSMLLSSSSMCACFFIGAYTPMPAVQMFALYAAVALAINFFLQMTCFLAIFTLDVRRQRSNRLDILCCIRLGKSINSNSKSSGVSSNVPLSGHRDQDVICSPPTQLQQFTNGHSIPSLPNDHVPATFQPTATPPPDQGGFLYAFFRDLYAPALMNDTVRLAVMVVFAGWLCSSLIVINRVHIGLEQELTMPDDSYMRHYFETYREQLQVGPPVYFMIQGNDIDLASEQVQNSFCSLRNCDSTSVMQMINYLAQHESKNAMIASSPSYFLDNFIKYTSDSKCCSQRNVDQSMCLSSNQTESCEACTITDSGRPSPNDFYRYLPFYLEDLPNDKCILGGKAQFLPSVKLNRYRQNVTSIEASYVMTYHTPLKTSEDFYEALRKSRMISQRLTDRLRSATNSSNVQVRPYSLPHVFYEQYLSMWADTTASLAMSIGSIFVVTYLFLGLDLHSASIVAFTITMIVINMLGLMYWWEISLNAISLVNLVVAVGISVEFCAHLLMTYKTSTEPTKKLRAQECLAKMGASILSGITLTDCGILVLAFAKSKIFQVFYFRMYLGIIVFGTLHSLIFLPVFLSIVGPPLNSDRLILQQIKLHQSFIDKEKQTLSLTTSTCRNKA